MVSLSSGVSATSVVSTVRTEVSDGAKEALSAAMPRVHDVLVRSPQLNEALGTLTRPIIKRKFNAPDKPGGYVGPAPLRPQTIEQARALMAQNFKPEEGKLLIGIAGGGRETVHTFVVSGVKPDGSVMITQAIAQVGNQPEAYRGVAGHIDQALDKLLGNKPNRMQGVVEDDWSQFAIRAKRNSIVIMELDTDPKTAERALVQLKAQVGKPYDSTMLAADPATKATQEEMYCTEVSSWFINQIRPGTIKPSQILGYPVYQVKDHLAATEALGGPLKVLFNGENRLDIAGQNPVPRP